MIWGCIQATGIPKIIMPIVLVVGVSGFFRLIPVVVTIVIIVTVTIVFRWTR